MAGRPARRGERVSRREVKSWAGHAPEELRRRWGRKSVHLYGKIDSTNAAARDLAEGGAPAGTVVLAREQTEGRGRAGRAWHSPPGGVYLSMVFRPAVHPLPPMVSILAGLGIARGLKERFPDLDPALKWPNDLMADGRKLGGVLAEAATSEGETRFLVVGAGVNVKPIASELPRSLRKRVTWVEDHVEEEVDPAEVADAIVEGMESRLREPPATLDARTLDLLDRYDWLRDRRVRVIQTEGEAGLPGVSVGIAPDGALLFRPDRGALRRLTSATVEPEPEEEEE